jgi:hypothetical protein
MNFLRTETYVLYQHWYINKTSECSFFTIVIVPLNPTLNITLHCCCVTLLVCDSFRVFFSLLMMIIVWRINGQLFCSALCLFGLATVFLMMRLCKPRLNFHSRKMKCPFHITLMRHDINRPHHGHLVEVVSVSFLSIKAAFFFFSILYFLEANH